MSKLVLSFVWLLLLAAACGGRSEGGVLPPAVQPADSSLLGSLAGTATVPSDSVTFEPNLGQASNAVDFIGKSRGYNLYILGSEIVFDMILPNEQNPGATPGVVAVSLLNANMLLAGQGEEQLPGVSNFLYGEKTDNWIVNVPTYARVRYSNIYPGTHIVFYGSSNNEVENDFIVTPKGNYSDIWLSIKGAQQLTPSTDGGIDIKVSGGGTFKLKKPFAYQQTGLGTKVEVSSSYILNKSNLIGFSIANYDKNLDLVIDPVTLSYSSYLGGSVDDVILAQTVDSSGNTYVAGWTKSATFQTASAYDATANGGNFDAFVSKISSSGTLSISTYFGGNGDEAITSIKVDTQGNVYVAGYTTSTNFPTAGTASAEPFSTSSNHGGYDAFMARLSPSITLSTCASSTCFSAYLGGTGFDTLTGIDFDTSSSGCTTAGQPCVIGVGTTSSSSGIVVNGPMQTTYGGGTSDAFVVKVTTGSPFGANALNYYGGSGRDIGIGIAGETTGNPPNIYIVGQTDSAAGTGINVGSTVITSPGGARDGFAAKVTGGLSSKTWGTYVGGAGDESVGGIAIYPKESSSSIHIIGTTTNGSSGSFTATNGTSYHAAKDIFVAKLSSDGTAFNYLTFIGGSGDDDVPGTGSIVVDSIGRAWFGGRSKTSGLTTVGAISGSGHGSYTSGAVSMGLYGRIETKDRGDSLNMHSYLGPTSSSGGDALISALALQSGNNNTIYITGYASESNFPSTGTTTRSFQGGKDGFTTQISTPSSGCPSETISSCVRGSNILSNNTHLEILHLSASGSSGANNGSTKIGSSASISIPSGYRFVGSGATTDGGDVTNGYFALHEMLKPDSTSSPTSARAVSYTTNPGTNNSSVAGYMTTLRINGTTPTCCTNTSDIHIVTAETAATNSLAIATATLPAGYTLIGGGSYVSVHTNSAAAAGNYIFASYPSQSANTLTTTGFGALLDDHNCLQTSLSPLVHTNAGGSSTSTTGGTLSPVTMPSSCDSWTSISRDIGVGDGAKITSYVVGIKTTTLAASKIFIGAAVGNNASSGNDTVTCDLGSGYIVVSGGGMATWSSNQEYLVNSYPSDFGKWTAKALQATSTTDSTSQLIVYCIGIATP